MSRTRFFSLLCRRLLPSCCTYQKKKNKCTIHTTSGNHLTITFPNLWANLADDKLIVSVLFFLQKVGFNISCKLSPQETSKLSPQETICLKCQCLFSGMNKKKYFKISSAEVFTQHVKCWIKSCQISHKMPDMPQDAMHTSIFLSFHSFWFLVEKWSDISDNFLLYYISSNKVESFCCHFAKGEFIQIGSYLPTLVAETFRNGGSP